MNRWSGLQVFRTSIQKRCCIGASYFCDRIQQPCYSHPEVDSGILFLVSCIPKDAAAPVPRLTGDLGSMDIQTESQVSEHRFCTFQVRCCSKAGLDLGCAVVFRFKFMLRGARSRKAGPSHWKKGLRKTQKRFQLRTGQITCNASFFVGSVPQTWESDWTHKAELLAQSWRCSKFKCWATE